MAEQDLFKRLAQQHGEPIQWPRKNTPALNEPYFAGLYAAEHYVLFEADEQKFYQYQRPERAVSLHERASNRFLACAQVAGPVQGTR